MVGFEAARLSCKLLTDQQLSRLSERLSKLFLKMFFTPDRLPDYDIILCRVRLKNERSGQVKDKIRARPENVSAGGEQDLKVMFFKERLKELMT